MLNDFGSSFQIISICVFLIYRTLPAMLMEKHPVKYVVTYQREGVLLCVHMQNIYRINDRLVSVIESFTYILLFVHFRQSSSFLARNFSYQMFSVLKLLLTLCCTGLVQELYYLIMCIVSSWQWPLVQSSAAT